MINQNGTLSIDTFIEKVLYDKKRLLLRKNPLGIKGDFITAPLVSPLFSEMIEAWLFLDETWKTEKFSFVELGPGDGIFKTFCKTLKSFPEFEKSVKIYLLEKAKNLKNTENTIKYKNVV